MVVPPLFELLFSQKTILQQRGRRLLIPHTPDITITLLEIYMEVMTFFQVEEQQSLTSALNL